MVTIAIAVALFLLGLLATKLVAQNTIPPPAVVRTGVFANFGQVNGVATLGSGLRLTMKDSALELNTITAPTVMRQVAQTILFSATIPATQTTLAVRLMYTPAPGTLLMIHSAMLDGLGHNIMALTPTGPDTKALNIELPTYRPFRGTEQVLAVYWTLDPP